jgi:hypothetical protein
VLQHPIDLENPSNNNNIKYYVTPYESGDEDDMVEEEITKNEQ